MDIPGLFFLYFRLFNTVDSKQMFNINLADDWIRTVDLWYRSVRSTNWATTTSIHLQCYRFIWNVMTLECKLQSWSVYKIGHSLVPSPIFCMDKGLKSRKTIIQPKNLCANFQNVFQKEKWLTVGHIGESIGTTLRNCNTDETKQTRLNFLV